MMNVHYIHTHRLKFDNLMDLLFCGLLTLKLTGVLTLTWLQVFTPLIVEYCVLGALVVFWAFVGWVRKKANGGGGGDGGEPQQQEPVEKVVDGVKVNVHHTTPQAAVATGATRRPTIMVPPQQE